MRSLSLPGRNRLSQVSTTCSGCIYHSDSPNASAWRACVLPVDTFVLHAPSSNDVTSAHAFAQGSKSEWLIAETMMRNSAEAGRRRGRFVFDDTRARGDLFRIAIAASGSFATTGRRPSRVIIIINEATDASSFDRLTFLDARTIVKSLLFFCRSLRLLTLYFNNKRVFFFNKNQKQWNYDLLIS